MKKYLVILVFAFGLVGFSSCSSQDDLVEGESWSKVEESKEMKDLMASLETYNTQLYANNIQTRGFWSWLWGKRRVAYADAVGAIFGLWGGWFGSVIGAGIFSSFAYEMEKDSAVCIEGSDEEEEPVIKTRVAGEPIGDEEKIFLEENALDDVVLHSSLDLYDDSVGYFHNKILMDMYLDESCDSQYDSIQKIDYIYEKAKTLTPSYGQQNLTQNDILGGIKFDDFSSALQTMFKSETYDNYVNEYIKIYPEYEYELKFVKEYINTLCTIESEGNPHSYAEGVLDIINSSSVSNDVKKRLGHAVITGNASARLWNIK